MKEQYFDRDASGTVVVMAFLSPHPRGWTLNRVSVPLAANRGQGWGTRLLEHICDVADIEGVSVWLGVDPDDPTMFDRVAKWYQRHGFHELLQPFNECNNVMVRKPKKRGH